MSAGDGAGTPRRPGEGRRRRRGGRRRGPEGRRAERTAEARPRDPAEAAAPEESAGFPRYTEPAAEPEPEVLGPPRALLHPVEAPPALPAHGRMAHIVGIKLRPAGALHEYDAGGERYTRDELVVVESDQGPRVATVAVGSVRAYTHERLRKVLRRASAEEVRARAQTMEKEREAYLYCKERVRDRQMPIKLIQVEVSARQGRATFYFASEERVDFRDLVRDLSQRLHMRVDMRQVGVRDEAKMVGGIGSCGRELCCSTFLPAFVPVSIKMAKDQGLVLNPSKLAGQCGRLKCCLVYEHDLYKEMGKGLPKIGKRVKTPAGIGRVTEVDVLSQKVRVVFEEGGVQTFPGSAVEPLSPPTQGSSVTPLVPDE